MTFSGLWTLSSGSRMRKRETKTFTFQSSSSRAFFWQAFTLKTPVDIANGAEDKKISKKTSPEAPPISTDSHRAVVLIDEIDKADPDLPNSLLGPISNRGFEVSPLNARIECERPAPLVIFTTNEFRRLSRPFLRRCIELHLKMPDIDQMVDIAMAHFGADVADMARKIAVKIQSNPQSGSVAEFIDCVKACRELDVSLSDERFAWLMDATVKKPGGRHGSR